MGPSGALEEGGAAFLTTGCKRFIPSHKVTRGVVLATIVGFSGFGFLFQDFSATLRAGNLRVDNDRLGEFTFGVSGASHKFTEASCFNYKILAAIRADFFCNLFGNLNALC